MIGVDPLQILGVERTVNHSAVLAGSTGRFDRFQAELLCVYFVRMHGLMLGFAGSGARCIS
jgi:hypothetical protein